MEFEQIFSGIGCLGIVGLLVAVILVRTLRIAQEYERAVVFRLGRAIGIRGPGLYLLLPFIEQERRVDVRTVTVAVERQETITKDSVAIKVNAVVWYRIADPVKAVIAVVDYRSAVQQVALTSLRNIIGQHLLDEVLRERDQINATTKQIVDAATAAWGIDVQMVEIKDVEIPEALQRAMAREAEAVRERRARIIKADAELEASLKLSQGANQIAQNPIALELRRMQMLSEIGAENNSTTTVLMPSDFVMVAREFASSLHRQSTNQPTQPAEPPPVL